MKNREFSQSTIEKLMSYVYLLTDPRTERVFYVGKGKGNRVFQHISGALENPELDNKIQLIKEIISEKREVDHYILRHGMTDKVALEVEAALIDYTGLKNLTNLVSGHHSKERGISTIEQILIDYEAKPLVVKDSAILINIASQYRFGMSSEELYEATRGTWRVNPARVKGAEFALSVFKGVVREVYKIDEWKFAGIIKGRNRYDFTGKVADEGIRDKYLHKSVSNYWKRGGQWPTRYANC